MLPLVLRRVRFLVTGGSARAARVWSCAGLLLTCAACSTDLGDVFGEHTHQGGQAEGGGGPDGANGSGATGAGASGSGGTIDQTTGNQTTGEGAAPPDTSATTDVTAATTTDTSSSTSTGRPQGTTVDCDDGPCSVEDDGVCCYDDGSETSQCLDSANGCVGGVGEPLVAIHCQVPDDCDGDICCAHRALPSGESPYDRTECASSCMYPNLYLCDIFAPDCPIYQTPNGPLQSICKQSTLLPVGYYVCGLM
jgi:hypothetical protein